MHAGAADPFEREKRYLFSIAYRLLGSVVDAEDAVQDAWLRWQRIDPSKVKSPRAYLASIVTRLCLDTLKEARRRREIYVGPWLPEPLLEDPSLLSNPEDGRAKDVSFALMLALERLSPLERAAFILHDVFDLEYGEIASTIGRGEAACRQLASRARRRLKSATPGALPRPDQERRIAEAFFQAARHGDLHQLRHLLAEDVVLHADGGGRKVTALNPIFGADNVSRFLAGLARKGITGEPFWTHAQRLNSHPGWVTIERDGTLQTTAVMVCGECIMAIYITRNPDKLAHVEAALPQPMREHLSPTHGSPGAPLTNNHHKGE
ncbi:sigma-70 family RNA polymerase sigma factor [Marinicauda pacifica]|uniref:sigma-70 family RNA polymerase sigma factor n=1 Tax=Marinicauda pacifica TaxID=1133559 RepID=UPI0035C86AA1